MELKKNYLLGFFILLFSLGILSAHPMPNSVLLLDIYHDHLQCKVKIPLKEMELAVPFDVKDHGKLNIRNKMLESYLQQHFSVKGSRNENWAMKLKSISVQRAEQSGPGKYDQLVADYTIVPGGDDVRKFTIYYDAVIHQVNSHRALVSMRQDWETGRTGEEDIEIGIIGYNLDTGKANPLSIDLEHGSGWTGFKSMVRLGIRHIAEGTDHLMFLLVLLLTTPLIAIRGNWHTNPSTKGSLLKILKISIAFTLGHSVTLALATLQIISFPTQPVEIIIAISILITAAHAIKPLFPDKENIIAGIFGLIHGLAFSTVLSELHLSNERLVLSLLGFNIGIEFMQLMVIFLVMPWFLLISRYKIYIAYKDFLAIFAMASSIVWMISRYTKKQNVVSEYLDIFAKNSILFVVFLCISFLIFYIFKFQKNNAANEL